MQLSGIVRVLAVAAVAASVTAWVAQDGHVVPGAAAQGNQQSISKLFSADRGEDHLEHLNMVVILGPVCAVEGEVGVRRRPLAISTDVDYGLVVSSSGMVLQLVDAATSEAIPHRFSGAAPDEARQNAKELLGQSAEFVDGDAPLMWSTTVKPVEGKTWGEVTSEADISVTWESVPPKAKK